MRAARSVATNWACAVAHTRCAAQCGARRQRPACLIPAPRASAYSPASAALAFHSESSTALTCWSSENGLRM